MVRIVEARGGAVFHRLMPWEASLDIFADAAWMLQLDPALDL